MRIKYLAGKGGMDDRTDVFIVDKAFLWRQQRWCKNDVWKKGAAFCLEAVKDAAVDKQAAAFWQLYFICTDQTEGGALGDIDEFQLMMPVPVDAVEVKLPDIFRIVCERIAVVSVPDGFPQCFVRHDLISSHSASMYALNRLVLGYCIINMRFYAMILHKNCDIIPTGVMPFTGIYSPDREEMQMKNQYNKTVTACFVGYIVQAIVNNFTPLLFLFFQRSYQIPLSQITLLVTFNFGIQLLVDLLSVGFVDRIGYRISIVAAHVLAAAGLALLTVLPEVTATPFTGILISVMIYAIGGGLLEVLVSPVVEACPSDNKEKAMSMLHSFYCWGHAGVVLLSTLFFYVAGIENWCRALWEMT